MFPDKIQEIIAENAQLSSENSELKQRIEHQQKELTKLGEMLRALKNYRFGRRTERLESSDAQPSLFNEAEVAAAKPDPTPEYAPEPESQKPSTNSKKRRVSRRPLPPSLERRIIEVPVPESEKMCSNHHEKVCIGSKVTERLEFIPAKIIVNRYVRPQFACKKCDEPEISIGDLPPSPIPKSVASPSLLAAIVTAKYTDHLPLYRQEDIFQRAGLEISRSQMARWLIQASELLKPIAQSILEELLDSSYLQCDETSLQVLKEPGRKAQTLSYIWTLARPPGPDKPLVYYHYSPTRAGSVPRQLLESFTGTLQVDGFPGYNALFRTYPIQHLACMAHIRRKFHEAYLIGGKKPGHALDALQMIGFLFRLEQEWEGCTPEERTHLRQLHAAPKVEEIYAWLLANHSKAPPQSYLGKALAYALSEWPAMKHYLTNGLFQISNNWIENVIRPLAIGRKNWLFSATPAGASASAIYYTLTRSAVLNDLDPFKYFTQCFERLSTEELTADLLSSLMPHEFRST